MTRLDLITHLIERGAVKVNFEKKFVVPDDGKLLDALDEVGINSAADVEEKLGGDESVGGLLAHLWRN